MVSLPELPNDLRVELIETLCEGYPLLATPSSRSTWLMNLPQNVRKSIVHTSSHCETDLALIIDTLQRQRLTDGRLPLLILIDAAIRDAKGLAVCYELSQLRTRVAAALERPFGQPSPALMSEPSYEELVIGENEKVTIDFLVDALRAAKSVARLQVRGTTGFTALGTGWLIASNVLVTAAHVVKARSEYDLLPSLEVLSQQAKDSVAWFGYDKGTYTEYRCTDLLFFDTSLDCAMLRVKDASVDGKAIAEWGILKVLTGAPSLGKGTRLNILQHPGGRIKELALRSNYYLDSTGSRLHYLSDTENGSSGSPVLNDLWRVVAVHRGWAPYDKYYKDQPIRFSSLGLQYSAPSPYAGRSVANMNEGVSIASILEALPSSVRDQICSDQGRAAA